MGLLFLRCPKPSIIRFYLSHFDAIQAKDILVLRQWIPEGTSGSFFYSLIVEKQQQEHSICLSLSPILLPNTRAELGPGMWTGDDPSRGTNALAPEGSPASVMNI